MIEQEQQLGIPLCTELAEAVQLYTCGGESRTVQKLAGRSSSALWGSLMFRQACIIQIC